jgi:RNA polymerase sigma factor (sigma-70 family)
MTDDDLIGAARHGDAAALGMLVQRHRAGMRATALSVLGNHPDADDAVQEACLIVLRRLGDLREPKAFGGWLRTVVLNQARARLRSRAATPVADPEALLRPLDDLDPARLLERHALGDWLWQAIGRLSPEHRIVLLLRHFTGVTAYEQIAQVCGIPVGTVRSRLSHGRVRLIEELTATAELAHDDHRVLTRSRSLEATQILQAGRQSRSAFAEAIAASWQTGVETTWGQGKRTYGHGYPAEAMARDVGDGVIFRLAGVVAGPDVLIWETDLISPPEDPFHCPPGALWVHTLDAGLTSRIRIYHPRP